MGVLLINLLSTLSFEYTTSIVEAGAIPLIVDFFCSCTHELDSETYSTLSTIAEHHEDFHKMIDSTDIIPRFLSVLGDSYFHLISFFSGNCFLLSHASFCDLNLFFQSWSKYFGVRLGFDFNVYIISLSLVLFHQLSHRITQSVIESNFLYSVLARPDVSVSADILYSLTVTNEHWSLIPLDQRLFNDLSAIFAKSSSCYDLDPRFYDVTAFLVKRCPDLHLVMNSGLFPTIFLKKKFVTHDFLNVIVTCVLDIANHAIEVQSIEFLDHLVVDSEMISYIVTSLKHLKKKEADPVVSGLHRIMRVEKRYEEMVTGMKMAERLRSKVMKGYHPQGEMESTDKNESKKRKRGG
jgi:hypothetical protein